MFSNSFILNLNIIPIEQSPQQTSCMYLKKNIWFIFYFLLLFGLVYLVTSVFSTWQSIQTRSSNELAFLNKIFSSSIVSTFDQQEIMLELLIKDLVTLEPDSFASESTRIMDKLKSKQQSIALFGIFDTKGAFISSSSNINLIKKPNLKESENTRKSFNEALQKNEMVLGKTYYQDAIESWILPARKSIRSKDGALLGVISAAIKITEILPRLNELTQKKQLHYDQSTPFQSVLIHDESLSYAYISGITDHNVLKSIINTPIPPKLFEVHKKLIEQQTGLTLEDIKNQPVSLEYQSPDTRGDTKMYSLLYIPKYRLWSMTFLPRSHFVDQMQGTLKHYLIAFITVLIVIFLLFRYIHKFEINNRKQLLQQANHDFLTGLHNRLFLEYAEPKWIYEGAKPFSVIFMDLDNFKNINDSYGHSYGDEILIQVADRIRSFFNKENLICRQGGDEFIILFQKTSQRKLEKMAQQLLDLISLPYKLDQYKFSIGASIGICRYPNDGDSFDSLFSAADTAMYEAKNKKNNYFVFTNEMHESITKKSNIEQALHTALKSNEFFMVYQPQITKQGELYGVEALIRWTNKELGFIPPDQFISIAVDSGLILELGHFIIRQSIRDIAKLVTSQNQNNIRLSINISVRQFLEDGFLKQVKTALKDYEFPADRLTLEITESIFIDDLEFMLPLFQSIKDLGVKFSLDDFGTGFSSLSILRNLPVDELKIDKSFIDHITDNAQDKAMVLNILNIASNLNLVVVAEGIETKEQSDVLNEFSCDVQQGYLYSRPVKYQELIQYIADYKTFS